MPAFDDDNNDNDAAGVPGWSNLLAFAGRTGGRAERPRPEDLLLPRAAAASAFPPLLRTRAATAAEAVAEAASAAKAAAVVAAAMAARAPRTEAGAAGEAGAAAAAATTGVGLPWLPMQTPTPRPVAPDLSTAERVRAIKARCLLLQRVTTSQSKAKALRGLKGKDQVSQWNKEMQRLGLHLTMVADSSSPRSEGRRLHLARKAKEVRKSWQNDDADDDDDEEDDDEVDAYQEEEEEDDDEDDDEGDNDLEEIRRKKRKAPATKTAPERGGGRRQREEEEEADLSLEEMEHKVERVCKEMLEAAALALGGGGPPGALDGETAQSWLSMLMANMDPQWASPRASAGVVAGAIASAEASAAATAAAAAATAATAADGEAGTAAASPAVSREASFTMTGVPSSLAAGLMVEQSDSALFSSLFAYANSMDVEQDGGSGSGDGDGSGSGSGGSSSCVVDPDAEFLSGSGSGSSSVGGRTSPSNGESISHPSGLDFLLQAVDGEAAAAVATVASARDGGFDSDGHASVVDDTSSSDGSDGDNEHGGAGGGGGERDAEEGGNKVGVALQRAKRLRLRGLGS